MHVEPLGLVEHLWIAVRSDHAESDELAARDRHVPDQRDVERPPLDERHRRDQAQRLVDGACDCRRATPRLSQPIGVLEQEQHRVQHHRLNRLDRAEQDHAQLRRDRPVVQPGVPVVRHRGRDRRVGTCADALELREQDRVELLPHGVRAALRLGVAVVGHGGGKRLVEAADLGDVVEREPEHVPGHADREGQGEGGREIAAAELLELVEEASDAAPDRLFEARPHRPHAERLVEGRALPVVEPGVAREHHHPERRAHEVRVRPDGEVLRAAEDVAGELVRSQEPAAHSSRSCTPCK
ncbi:MAG TPA: hypothetical protein VGJ25_10315 [Gaiellaceae bacterium]